jgi:hypothetical protein
MCPIIIAQKSDIIYSGFQGMMKFFSDYGTKLVNYLRNSHYIPCTPIYLAGRMTPKEIKNTHSISIASHQS